MKIVCISDTHCAEPAVPDGDILIHAGDLTYRGTVPESEPALIWLSELPHKYKIVIAGNHELGWEADLARNYYRPPDKQIIKPKVLDKFPTLIYLHNSGIEIEGFKIWGSPIQPEFCGWAFQKQRGEELRRHWEMIPDDTNILITHGPPAGYGDVNKYDERFGDKDLLDRVLQVKPKLHIYGHAHHGHGVYKNDNTIFINAAIMTEDYKPENKPIVIEYDEKFSL